MDPEIATVTLRPRSRAEHAALIALLDLGELLAEAPIDIEETRVIGGHMVALHAALQGLDGEHTRMTLDTDFGLHMSTLNGLDLVERFGHKQYRLRQGCRFYRQLDDDPDNESIVDVLIPNYTSRRGSNRQVGEINSFQTPGLAELLNAKPLAPSRV
jgi:hypothetical protein